MAFSGEYDIELDINTHRLTGAQDVLNVFSLAMVSQGCHRFLWLSCCAEIGTTWHLTIQDPAGS